MLIFNRIFVEKKQSHVLSLKYPVMKRMSLRCFFFIILFQISHAATGQKEILDRKIDSVHKIYRSSSGKTKIHAGLEYSYLMSAKDTAFSRHSMQQGLMDAIENNHHDLVIRAYEMFCHYHNGLGNKTEAIRYGLKRARYAAKFDFKSHQANSYLVISRFFLDLAEFDSANFYLIKSKDIFQPINEINGLAEVNDKLGLSQVMQGNYDASIIYYNEALSILEKSDSAYLKGLVNYHLGFSYNKKGDFELSLMYIHRALELWEPLSDIGNAPKWNALEMLGSVYFKLRQFEKAVEFHRQALLLRRITYTGILDESINLAYAYSYNNLAECYLSMGITDSAYWYAEKSLRIKLRPATVASNHDIANSYLNMTKINFNLGAKKIAELYADSAIYFYCKANWKDGIAESFLEKGYLLASENMRDDAISSFSKALEISTETKAKVIQKKALLAMADVLAKQGDYFESNSFLRRYVELNDSLYNADLNQRIAEMGVKYEVNKKELENAYLKQQNYTQKKTQYYLFLAIILFVVLFISLAIVVWLLRKNLLNKEVLLESRNELNSLKELQFIREIEQKNMELQRLVESIKNKNNMLKTVKEVMLEEIKNNCNAPVETFHKTVKTIHSHMVSDQDWVLLEREIQELSAGFKEKLMSKHPDLSPLDFKLLIYHRLKLSTREIASLMNIEEESVRKQKYRLRKKLNLDGDSLENYLNSL